MAGRGDIEAGRAYVTTYVKNSALVKGLNEIKGRLQGLGSGIMAVGGALAGTGAAIVTPLIGAVAHFAKMGSELADLSGRTGMTAGSLAELKFAAEQTGAGLAEIELAIKTMQKNGVTGTFDEVAARIAAIQDPAERTRVALETWGKTGTKLLPMIANLQALRQEARDLGLVPTEEAVQMADAIGDALDKVKSVISATIFEVGAALAPMLLPALETVKNIAGWFNRWAKENGAIIRTVFMIGAGLVAAGAVVTAIGAAVFGIGAAFGAAATIITTLGTVLGFLLNPVVLVLAALAAGVVLWARFTASGQAAVQGILNFFLPMVETIKSTIGGIGDALQAGDLALAAQIAVAGIQLVFLQGVNQITSMIGGVLGAFFGSVVSDLIRGDFQGAWDTVVRAMAAGWDAFAAGIVSVFAAAVNAIQQLWQSLTASMSVTLGGIEVALGALPGGFGKAAASAIAAARSGLSAGAGAVGAGIAITGSALGAVDEAMKKRAEDSAGKFGRGLGIDSATNAEDIRRRQQELDELKRQAAAAKEAAQNKQGGPDAVGSAVAELKSSSTVTGFSGFALGMAGQGGGGVAEMGKTLRQQQLIQQNMEKHLKRIADDDGGEFG